MRALLIACVLSACGAPELAACPQLRVDVSVRGNDQLGDAALRAVRAPLDRVSSGPLAYYDLYDVSLVDASRELEEAYLDAGYANARIADPDVQLSIDRSVVAIAFAVTEGPRFRLGAVRIEELDDSGASYGAALPFGVEPPPLPPPATPRELAGVREGDWFSRRALADAIDRVRALYEDEGYALIDIDPVLRTDLDHARIDVTVQIRRGRVLYVDAIEVLDERGERPEDVSLLGLRIGERCSRFEPARSALERAHPGREVRVRVEPRGETDRAIVRFLVLDPDPR